VAVDLSYEGGLVQLTITSAARSESFGRTRSSGTGLAALAARVQAMGGTFETGPRGAHWIVTARFPAGNRS
jgi:signal transduction histidine kinase